ncbi:MAG: restriction endonuclease subunit S [Hydrogenophilaceae bacterium]|jgi:type I restriction enzyme S subunit|nr:restriction endonuclease subunit S [Hydrogenophilaceae bacterium]
MGTIGDLCEQDRRTVSPDDPAAARLRFVGVEHVEADTGEISDGNGSRTGEGKSVNFSFTAEHVLYSKLRPYLNKVATPDFEGKCSTELIPLRPRPGVDRRFLAYALRRKAVADAITTASIGARMPRADLSILMRQPIPLPPIEEQRRIAAALDRAARLVKLHKQAAAKTRDLIPALFIDMFGDPATNPRGWPVKRLKELAPFVTSGSRGWGRYYAESGARFVRVQNLVGHRLDLSDIAFVKPPTGRETERARVFSGDVLVAITGAPGQSGFARDNIGEAYVNQHVAIIRPAHEIVLTEYLWAFIANENGGQRQLGLSSYGQTRPGLGLNDLRRLAVSVPPLRDQDRFMAKVRQLMLMETVDLQRVDAAVALQASILGEVFGDA